MPATIAETRTHIDIYKGLTNILALKLASQVALHKRGLASATVANEHKLSEMAIREANSRQLIQKIMGEISAR